MLRSPALTLAAPPGIKLLHKLSTASCVNPSLDQTRQHSELTLVQETRHCTASSL